MSKPEGSFSPATLSAPATAGPAGKSSRQQPAALKAVDKDTTAGVLFGIGAYGLWGMLPLYFFVLAPAG
ncbi:MAG TPA: EamA family transporter RarD, partial [Arthrobacter sp.]|nr:EamA family transporter RarD [Arthrobacter sp.]